MTAADNNGLTQIWSKEFPLIPFDLSMHNYPVHFNISSDGNFFVTGYVAIKPANNAIGTSEYSANIKESAFIIKADKDGNKLWNRTLGTGRGVYVKATADGGCIVAVEVWPYTKYGAFGADNCILYKLDANGNTQWTTSIPAVTPRTTDTSKKITFVALALTDDSGYMLVVNDQRDSRDIRTLKTEGISDDQSSTEYFNDIRMIRLDAQGQKTGESTITGKFNQEASDIVRADGGYLIVGSTTSYSSDTGNIDNDFHTTYELNYEGKPIRVYKMNPDDSLDSGCMVFLKYDYNQLLVKVDTNGKVIWSKTYGDTWPDYGTAALPVDGGFLVLGEGYGGRLSSPYTYNDRVERNPIWDVQLLKVDGSGNLLWKKMFYLNNSSESTSYGTGIVASGGNYVLTGTGGGLKNGFYEVTVGGSGNQLSVQDYTFYTNPDQIERTPAGEYVLLFYGLYGPELTKLGNKQTTPSSPTGKASSGLDTMLACLAICIVAGLLYLQKKK